MAAIRAALSSLVLALVLGACARPEGGASTDANRPLPSPVPEIVARVNGQAIRLGQIVPMARAELESLPEAERDGKKPEALRRALEKYVDRELLVQEALSRGVEADSRQVDWAYDQMRREHPDDKAWERFLAGQGMDPQSLRAELRAQHTIAALLDQEMQERPVPEKDAGGGEGKAAVPQPQREEVQAGLLARLRAKARIEILL
jgi:hypothetical protein